jgi:hypothetical protein
MTEANKTEYRIVTVRTSGADRYLQFKLVVRKKRRTSPWWRLWEREYEEYDQESWRYVPRESYPVVHGYWLLPHYCPKTLPFMHEWEFISSFNGHEDFYPHSPARFARNWPDITKYFDHLWEKRCRYLDDEKASKEAPTTYL